MVIKFFRKIFGIKSDNDKDVPDFVKDINKYVNSSIAYLSDMKQYKKSDVWVRSPKSKKGDCEDYVLTKQFLLLRTGKVYTDDLVVWFCKYGKTDHAVLVYKGLWVLDNRTDIIWDINKTNYTHWQRADIENRKIHNEQIT